MPNFQRHLLGPSTFTGHFPRLRHNEVEEEEVIQVAGENTSTRPGGKWKLTWTGPFKWLLLKIPRKKTGHVCLHISRVNSVYNSSCGDSCNFLPYVSYSSFSSQLYLSISVLLRPPCGANFLQALLAADWGPINSSFIWRHNMSQSDPVALEPHQNNSKDMGGPSSAPFAPLVQASLV